MNEEEYDPIAEAEAVLAEPQFNLVDEEEYFTAVRQINNRQGRPMTEDEFYVVAKELNDLYVSALLLKAWKLGEIFMDGIRDGEVLWSSDEGETT